MKTLAVSLSLGALLVAGCADPNQPYKVVSEPEKIEWSRDNLDVYPDDVRQNPDQYNDTTVAWAGIVKSTDAREFGDGYIRLTTTFEHHYFDWEQNNNFCGPTYDLSPRGEGLFKANWIARKSDLDADWTTAEAYAGPGKLAIVYGNPIGVDTNGVIQLRYRYLRIIDTKRYSTYEFDYGRLGQPVTYLR